MLKSEEFLPITFLIRHGGQALACSMSQWQAHLEWLAWRNTLTGQEAETDGRGRRDPRPTAISISIPWPERLGVDLGGGTNAFENACLVASDIRVTAKGGEWLTVWSHQVAFDDASSLVVRFGEEATGRTSDSLTLHVRIGDHGSRAQRTTPTPERGDAHYCFRLIPRHRPNLESLALPGSALRGA